MLHRFIAKELPGLQYASVVRDSALAAQVAIRKSSTLLAQSE